MVLCKPDEATYLEAYRLYPRLADCPEHHDAAVSVAIWQARRSQEADSRPIVLRRAYHAVRRHRAVSEHRGRRTVPLTTDAVAPQEKDWTINEYLPGLPPLTARVLNLRYVAGMRVREVARETGKDERVVRQELRSGHDRIRAKLVREMRGN